MLHRCSVASLNCCAVAALRCGIFAPLQRCAAALFPRCIVAHLGGVEDRDAETLVLLARRIVHLFAGKKSARRTRSRREVRVADKAPGLQSSLSLWRTGRAQRERPPPARKQNLPLVALFWAMQTSTIVPQFFPAECKYSISSPILPVNIASHLTFRGGMQTADARKACSAGPCEVGYGAMRAAMHGEIWTTPAFTLQ